VTRSSGQRHVALQAFAKINLALEVRHRRPDGFHEIRTIFHTISAADRIHLTWTPRAPASLHTTCSVPIPDNLAERAARAVLDATGAKGRLEINIEKRIPMGGGLGGGSTDAAAVLLALPVLTGRPLPPGELERLAAGLGSDVPFFLEGGCALGAGRGEELYPLPSPGWRFGVLLAPGIHVSTPDAYRSLARPAEGALTLPAESFMMNKLQRLAWALGQPMSAGGWRDVCGNDFESAVFHLHPILKSLKTKLLRLGAAPALMSGSGSSLFGFFQDRESQRVACSALTAAKARPVSLVGRSRYRRVWASQLSDYAQPGVWPPAPR